jgi:hypothetical protein
MNRRWSGGGGEVNERASEIESESESEGGSGSGRQNNTSESVKPNAAHEFS